MKRFAMFAILGPCLAGATLYLIVLPVGGWLEGQGIEMKLLPGQAFNAFLMGVFAALVVGLFDRIAELIEVPYRPVAAAVVGWILAVMVLRDVLALPDLPGWFAMIGLLGGIPAFVCSWLVSKLNPKQSPAGDLKAPEGLASRHTNSAARLK
jgi:hypothetical protein